MIGNREWVVRSQNELKRRSESNEFKFAEGCAAASTSRPVMTKIKIELKAFMQKKVIEV